MTKNVLIISSSPRKSGNSDLLCDQFMAGAKEAGQLVEKISLREKEINYCTGCGACFKGNECSQKDHMTEILKKMIAADVIVMATPVYFYTMCAQMKTLIDRTCARYREIKNTEFYFILTAADNNKHAMNRTIEEFRGFTGLLSGAAEKGIIYGTGAWEKGDVKEMPVMQETFLMAMSI